MNRSTQLRRARRLERQQPSDLPQLIAALTPSRRSQKVKHQKREWWVEFSAPGPKPPPAPVGPMTHALARKTAAETMRRGIEADLVRKVDGQEVHHLTPKFPGRKRS
jgi:hypothetical protein